MKIWTSEHTFEHPWETVVQAAWRKYPNPMNPGVKGIDVVDRKIDKNGVLRSHRLMTTEWGMPDWLTKFVGMNQNCYVSEHSEVNAREKTMKLRSRNFIGLNRMCYVSEHSDVDVKARSMAIRSRNLTFNNFITIDEHLVYQKHPEDSKKTLLKQEAVINIQGVPMTSYLENVVFGNCNKNAHKGRDAMEWVIDKIKDEAQDLVRSADDKLKHLKTFSNEQMDQIKNFSTSYKL